MDRAQAKPVPVAGLAARIAGFPVVSCDIFDTALHRCLARPEDVLLAVGAQARARGLVACPPAAFREYRLEAERAARAAAADRDEVTLAEVYARFPACHLAADAAALAALEFSVERSVCRAAEPLRAVLAARSPGQRLVFVSDSMLPGEWLAGLLREAGYGADCTVFSSADAGLSKHTGRLFPHVLAALGRTPAEVVHLGDNLVSDVIRAREHGITALHLPQRGCPPEPDRLAGVDPMVRLLHSHRRSLAAAQAAPSSHPSELQRYATALLLGYTLFILAEAKRRGIRRLYFLSRDGYLPFAFARMLAPRLLPDASLEYLHVSRRAIALPALHPDLTRLAEEIGQGLHGQPVANALEVLGVDADTTAGLLRGLGIEPSRQVDRQFGQAEIHRLFEAHRPFVLERSAARRAAALAYLDQAGFLAPGPRLVVDVGWRGTTQEALAQLTGLPAADVVGCYVGLLPQALRPALNPGNAAGYLFAFGHPKPLMDIVMDGYIVLELLFSAPQTTVLHYEMEAGRAVPIHGTEREPGGARRRQTIESLERGCLEEVAALDAMLDGAWPEAIDPHAALLDLEGLLTRPSAAEVALINGIPFVQGTAGGENGTAVNPVSRRQWLLHPRATLRRIERAAWRGGSARSSLPWPLPSMTYRELHHRVDRLCRLLRVG